MAYFFLGLGRREVELKGVDAATHLVNSPYFASQDGQLRTAYGGKFIKEWDIIRHFGVSKKFRSVGRCLKGVDPFQG